MAVRLLAEPTGCRDFLVRMGGEDAMGVGVIAGEGVGAGAGAGAIRRGEVWASGVHSP